MRFSNQLLETSAFYLDFYDYAKDDFETCTQYFGHLMQTLDDCGDKDLADSIEKSFRSLIDAATAGAAS